MEPVLYVVDDLVTEILSWLPVKSLIRFKCVCRSWNSLISNPSFLKFYFNRSFLHHDLLFISKTKINDRVSDFFVTFCSKRDLLTNQHSTIVTNLTPTKESRIPLKHKYHIIGSCNGLLCLRGYTHHHHDVKQWWIRFWNPLMKLRSKKSPSLFVKFFPPILPIFGFGNDESSDTYKVVVFFTNLLEFKIPPKVYTMGGDSWRDIQDFPGLFPSILPSVGSFLSGTLNWIAYWRSSHQLSIVSLDLHKETFRQLLLPLGVSNQVTLGVLMDCLCVSVTKATHFVVWQMKEFGDEKSWTQIVKVCYQHLQIDRSTFPFPVCMSENGDVLVLKDTYKRETFVYCRRDNTIHTHISWDERTWIDFKDYVPSLVLPY